MSNEDIMKKVTEAFKSDLEGAAAKAESEDCTLRSPDPPPAPQSIRILFLGLSRRNLENACLVSFIIFITNRIIAIENMRDFVTIHEQYPTTVICIDYVAAWYLPSQHFLTDYHALSEQYQGAVFCLVDIDSAKDIAEAQNVRAPMFRVYKAKKQLAELSGLNVLGNTNDVNQVLRYEIERAGSKKSDPAVKIVITNPPEAQGAAASAPPPTLKLTPAPEKKASPADEKPKKNSMFDTTTESSRPKYEFFPQSSYVLFNTGDTQKIIAKIIEFHQSGGGLKLETSDLGDLQKVLTHLPSNTAIFTDSEIATLHKLAQWPADKVFPVLDLLRFVVLHPDAAIHFATKKEDLLQVLGYMQGSSAPTNQFLAARVVANLFNQSSGRNFLVSNFDLVVQRLLDLAGSENKNVQIAATTLILNYTVLLAHSRDMPKLDKIAGLLLKILATKQDDEAIFRIIIATGTIASCGLRHQSQAIIPILGQQPGTSDKCIRAHLELDKILEN